MFKYGIFILLILSNPLQARIYTWTDPSGVVHFSDRPHPGSNAINLPAATSNVNGPTSPPLENEAPVVAKANADSAFEYTKLIISQPRNNETIRNNQGYVPVITEVTPELRDGDNLQLLFDGNVIGAPQPSLVFTLKAVERGAHTLAFQVIDSGKSVISTSDSITFYMQRPRVGMGQNANPN